MQLFLQFGYAMRPTALELLRNWDGGTIILSPRDIDPASLLKVSTDLKKAGAKLFFDPQFYLPHADHKTLCEHSYWPKDFETADFFNGGGLHKLIADLSQVNAEVGASAFILPGMHAAAIDDLWLESHQMIAMAASKAVPAMPKIATVALSAEALIDDEQIHDLLDAIEDWPVDGIYLVCEHPQGDYLVKDTNWLINQLDLAAGIRLQGKEVIAGYTNHQSLILAIASVNAIASGTFMNVRSFMPEKFVIAPADEVKTKSIWYYCPHALSEYKITFMDVAFRQNILSDMQASLSFGSNHVDQIFSGPDRPSTVSLKERNYFLHYLQCLSVQAGQSRLSSFDETVKAHNLLLDSAESFLTKLSKQGVRGQNRDYAEIIDVNRAALAAFETTRGPMMRHAWTTLK